MFKNLLISSHHLQKNQWPKIFLKIILTNNLLNRLRLNILNCQNQLKAVGFPILEPYYCQTVLYYRLCQMYFYQHTRFYYGSQISNNNCSQYSKPNLKMFIHQEAEVEHKLNFLITFQSWYTIQPNGQWLFKCFFLFGETFFLLKLWTTTKFGFCIYFQEKI